MNFSINYENYYRLILDYETQETKFDESDPNVKKAYEKAKKYLIYWFRQLQKVKMMVLLILDTTKISIVLWAEITGLVQQVSLRRDLYKKWTALNPGQIFDYYIEVTQRMLSAQKSY